ncbi:MAG: methyl-accepting chemotaxis protein [Mangrovicoccus sp.]
MSKFWGKNSEKVIQKSDDAVSFLEKSHVIFRISMDQTILAASGAFASVFGFEPSEIAGKPYSTIVRPKDHESPDLKQLWAQLSAGKMVSVILPRLNKQGEEIWLDANYYPVMQNGEAPTEILVIAKEISEYHLRRRDNRGKADAILRSMAFIEFDLNGIILDANDLFLGATGYTLDEIKGQHHRIFMPDGEADSQDYADFWQRLGAGASEQGQVKRVGKAGNTLWLEATYETLKDAEGRPFKVVKYAFDITAAKNTEADVTAKLQAIEAVQAVIEFDASGNILKANDIFCKALGYDREEIIGKHHRIFVEPSHANSPDYTKFWERLRGGETIQDEFKRIGKGGREVFIEASYNPIRDAEGKVVRVVKFAIDTTAFRTTLDQASEALTGLAEGDLTSRILRDLGDLDEIRARFNEAVTKIDQVMQKVLRNSGEVVVEVSAIRNASDELSRRTESQAATLEETAAALEELTNSVQGTTKQSQEARDKAKNAKEDTEKSSAVVDSAMTAMGRIAESSEKISKITSVIDDISFQTNLLALNAGIEAARAGAAGRGFAVVASEVRGLAQRSSEAAKEIAQLIDESSQEVRQGVDLVGQAEKALGQIDARVSEILNLILAIASAAEEQSSGITEMNRAVSDLDRVTQQNAAMAEETNAAMQQLGGRVDEIQGDVQYFTTSDDNATQSEMGGAISRAS